MTAAETRLSTYVEGLRSEARLADDVVARLAARRVTIAEDQSLRPIGARIAIRDRGGRERLQRVHAPPGDPRRPLADGEIRDKLERAARAVALPDGYRRSPAGGWVAGGAGPLSGDVIAEGRRGGSNGPPAALVRNPDQ